MNPLTNLPIWSLLLQVARGDNNAVPAPAYIKRKILGHSSGEILPDLLEDADGSLKDAQYKLILQEASVDAEEGIRYLIVDMDQFCTVDTMLPFNSREEFIKYFENMSPSYITTNIPNLPPVKARHEYFILSNSVAKNILTIVGAKWNGQLSHAAAI